MFWIILRSLGKIKESSNYEELSRSIIDDWGISRLVESFYRRSDRRFSSIRTSLLKILILHQNWFRGIEEVRNEIPILRILFTDPEIQSLIGVNRYQNILWFNKENFEILTRWLTLISVTTILNSTDTSTKLKRDHIHKLLKLREKWINKAQLAEYQLSSFFEELQKAQPEN